MAIRQLKLAGVPSRAGERDAVAARGRAWAATGAAHLAPPLARGIVGTILTAICLVSVLVTAEGVTGVALVLAIIVELVLLLMQLLFFSRRVLEFPSRAGYLALAAEVVLVYAPFALFGQGWVAVAGFLAGNVLLVLTSPVSWVAFAVVIASTGVAQVLVDSSAANLGYSMVSTLITGLVVYALSRLGSVVVQLQSAREEILRMGAADERLRIAQDLHDLLGYSLSAITLKTEVVRHLMAQPTPDSSQAALPQLDEVVALSQQALSDVRSVARDYRAMSVDVECRSAATVLRAAGIEPIIGVGEVDLPERVNTVLSTVVREAVTNVLRHSNAKHCSISLQMLDDQLHLHVGNDGAGDTPIAQRSGSGLDSLAVRLQQVGGTLDFGFDPPDRFLLRATAAALPAGSEAGPSR